MPLLLTTPKNTGDLDPNASSYDHIRIIKTVHNAKSGIILLQCEYGNDDGYGEWTSGIVGIESYAINRDDYASILTEMPNDGETSYQAVSRALYEWLIDNGMYDGTWF